MIGAADIMKKKQATQRISEKELRHRRRMMN